MKSIIKKVCLAILLLLPTISADAQSKFGYLSYSAIFKGMPEYSQAQETLRSLKDKYDAETKRSEVEFNKKFADFLQGQKDFPTSILQKRQKELQDLMEKGIQFKKDINELLDQAEAELKRPIETKLDAAIQQVGIENDYFCVINTDNHACPFIHTAVGEDITEKVKLQLSKNK